MANFMGLMNSFILELMTGAGIDLLEVLAWVLELDTRYHPDVLW
jgi:hypothetical protein